MFHFAIDLMLRSLSYRNAILWSHRKIQHGGQPLFWKQLYRRISVGL